MKRTLPLAASITALFSGCTTPSNSMMAIPPEVEKMSNADERLFLDLLAARGGVGYADRTLFPSVKEKELTRIEVLTPYDNKKTGVERWYVRHNGRDTVSYLVELIPDGHGGTTFTVRKD